ncbi:two-component sensor histidine kinase [Sphingobium sp. TA15]|uniref:histidine kinase n=3 Tax=Sphingobium indicum TaxID=332055 RepID=D4Z5R2_SPHIU|nr:ATP-binding protein [Sphingobium indicum]KEY98671.1 histidine kinase [Sphingomonas sp. BHC-A]BDD67333.1 two-component sensor histidine kinase [Sphingobium sp. TA15]APL95311.1 histidine kinase [Sphingobium indicum B90A]NYI22409.1 signal transduction histidine kinase [Sphingobium indicum]RYM02592.1 HAMP domain-containing protein [Sphingobium indicum]
MRRLRLWPQGVVGQIIILVALALFVAQAINFALLLRERQRIELTAQTAPGVYRIVDALDNRPDRRGGDEADRRGRVRFLDAAPSLPGQARPDVERRARAMFDDVGLSVRSIHAVEQNRPLPMRRWDNFRLRADGDRHAPMRMTRLAMAVEYQPGKWALTQTRIGGRPPRFGGWLVGQTLILYAIVLLPLLWVGRRLARPLKQLTRSAEQFARTGSADAVEERGPGDVRQLTMAFNAMRSRIFAMLNEKDRMLGAIGHDLRTPLASLRVRAESVEDEGERARMSETIDEMNRMLEDILSLARAGRSSEARQKVDLSALADAVVEDFLELGSPVDLADSERVVADVRPQQIRRALRNLIENAIVYGERAHVSVERADGAIRLIVADDGPGISEERMEEMMEPFTRLEGSRNRDTGGAGLGLALVRAIMIEHGGALKLANRAQGGLEASLVLPA